MNVDVLERSDDALRLMEQVLRGGGALAGEYPLVFGAGSGGRVVTVRTGGQVRSACALLARDLLVPGGELRAGLIGSVSTDPEHRGQGLAASALAAAEAALAAEGCLLALLWADDAAYYARRGYSEVGRELDLLLHAQLERLLPLSSGVRRVDPARDAAAVQELYDRHGRRVRRSVAETEVSLAMSGVHTLVRLRAGRVVAYACEGRGRDLAGVVHEWGGAPEDVLACVRGHMQRRGARGLDPALVLLAAHPECELVRRLVSAGAACFTGVLAQGKLLDPDRALERLASYTSARLDVEPLAPERWRIAHGARAVELDRAQLTALLFAPRGCRGGVLELERGLGLRLVGLPLTPFVWGLDSI